LNRGFHADAATKKWAGDISYVWTREGWLYLALAIVHGPMADNGSLLDRHSRRVIGWAPSRDIAAQFTAGQWCSNRMKRDLAIRALTSVNAEAAASRHAVRVWSVIPHELDGRRPTCA